MDRFETLLASLLPPVGARLHSICEHASENVCGIRSNADREREGTLLMEERGRERGADDACYAVDATPAMLTRNREGSMPRTYEFMVEGARSERL